MVVSGLPIFTAMRNLFVLAACSAVTLFAQDGQLDPTFANSGFAFFDPTVTSERSTCLHVKADGRILGGGNEYEGVNTECWILQCLPDGSLDPDFGESGRSMVNFCTSADRLTMLLSQPDGKVLAAGYENFNNEIVDQGIVFRLTAAGDLDTSWGLAGLSYVTATYDVILPAIALQPDGKVLAAGYYSHGSLQDGVVRRFLPNGDLDTTFGGNGQVLITSTGNDWINNVIVCPDGGILVGGTETTTLVAYRYLADGTLDPAFGVGGKLTGTFNNGGFIGGYTYMAVDEQQRILFYGNTTGTTSHIGLKAYLPDGTPDLLFGDNGEVWHDLGTSSGTAMRGELLPSGRLVIPLNGPDYPAFHVICFNADGSLSAGFGTNGIAHVSGSPAGAMSAGAQGDSALVVLGTSPGTPGSQPWMVRYTLDDLSTAVPADPALADTRIYPVPGQGQDLTVVPGCEVVEGTLIVRDAMGRTVMVNPESAADRIRLRGSANLPAGIYSVSMRTRCGARTVRFLVR